MSYLAFWGAIESGLIYGFVAFGVFLTFRVLRFPDLTVESSFPLGGAIAAAAIVAQTDVYTATLLAATGGCIAGLITAFLAVRCGILHLLASILTMVAGYSINIRIMGKPNISLLGEKTIFTSLEEAGIAAEYARPLLLCVLALLMLLLLARMLASGFGLAMRAAGENPAMLRAQGGDAGFYVYCGLAVSNGLVALGGALFAQANGFADINVGIGTIILGLAAVILGETLIPGRRLWIMLLACLAGAVVYRLVIALALGTDIFGLHPTDLNLVTAFLVTGALVAPKLWGHFRRR